MCKSGLTSAKFASINIYLFNFIQLEVTKKLKDQNKRILYYENNDHFEFKNHAIRLFH